MGEVGAKPLLSLGAWFRFIRIMIVLALSWTRYLYHGQGWAKQLLYFEFMVLLSTVCFVIYLSYKEYDCMYA